MKREKGFALVLVLGFFAAAGGWCGSVTEGTEATEVSDTPIETTVYVVVSPEDASPGNSAVRNAVRLSGSAYLFTGFENADGTVRIAGSAQMSVVLVEAEEIGGTAAHAVVPYKVMITPASPLRFVNVRRVTVTFRYGSPGTQREDRYQPAVRALLAAIRKADLSSGYARVVEVTHKAGASFSAVVELAPEGRP